MIRTVWLEYTLFPVLSKLQQMAPSVQCGDNLMTLAVKRTGAPPFLVDSGGFQITTANATLFFCRLIVFIPAGQAPLVPLSQMPHYCGFSMKRSRRDIQYSTPYRGCYVNKQVSAISPTWKVNEAHLISTWCSNLAFSLCRMVIMYCRCV